MSEKGQNDAEAVYEAIKAQIADLKKRVEKEEAEIADLRDFWDSSVQGLVEVGLLSADDVKNIRESIIRPNLPNELSDEGP